MSGPLASTFVHTHRQEAFPRSPKCPFAGLQSDAFPPRAAHRNESNAKSKLNNKSSDNFLHFLDGLLSLHGQILNSTFRGTTSRCNLIYLQSPTLDPSTLALVSISSLGKMATMSQSVNESVRQPLAKCSCKQLAVSSAMPCQKRSCHPFARRFCVQTEILLSRFVGHGERSQQIGLALNPRKM